MKTGGQSDLKLRVITASVIVAFITIVITLGIKLASPLPLLTLGLSLLLVASHELAQATYTSQSLLTESISQDSSDTFQSSTKQILATVRLDEQPEYQPSIHYLGLLRSALLLILISIPLAIFFSHLHQNCCRLNLIERLAGPIIASSTLIMFLACIAGRQRLSYGARTLMSGIAGLTLLGLGGSQLLLLASQPWMLIKLIIVVAVNDSMAYFVGRALGGMRLAPAISPKKTLSGSFAGLIGGTLVGMAMEGWNLSSIWIWIGLIISAQMADLAKSLLKREFLIKDFAATLPGHGGVLDRIDGVLGASLGLLVIKAL